MRSNATSSGPRRFARNEAGASLVEFVLILPIALMMYAFMCVLAQGMAIKRNVIFTARTITDLVAQQNTSVSSATLNCFLNAASAVMSPYPSAPLSIVVSQVQINADGTGTVIWSQAAYNGAARTVGSIVPSPGTSFNQGSFQILGEVSYAFQPGTVFLMSAANFTLSENIYEAPRASTSISVTP